MLGMFSCIVGSNYATKFVAFPLFLELGYPILSHTRRSYKCVYIEYTFIFPPTIPQPSVDRWRLEGRTWREHRPYILVVLLSKSQ